MERGVDGQLFYFFENINKQMAFPLLYISSFNRKQKQMSSKSWHACFFDSYFYKNQIL